MSVRVNVLVDPLMTDRYPLFHRYPAYDLLRTLFLADQLTIAPQLPVDGRFIAPQQLCNLCLATFGFLQVVNLVSFPGQLEKAVMLPQLVLSPIDRAALTN